MTVNWALSGEFGVLCDLVASDHLVCLTGAGISRTMRRKHDPQGTGATLPGWIPLLRELLDVFRPQMTPQDVESASQLLDQDDERPAISTLAKIARTHLKGAAQQDALTAIRDLGPLIGSRELILAASLIRRANPKTFEQRFREAVAEAPGQCTETHEALVRLLPRGIITFNYDGGHEEAWHRQQLQYKLINPTEDASEEAFRELLEDRLRKPFLLKAHGSVDSVRPLVLTAEEYRSLIAKNPSFRAFVQNLFTNFSFLMVGYGLDDPDFDLFLRTMAEQFASPLQTHIVIRPISQRHRRQQVERWVYGIRTLHINHFGEVPTVLDTATRTAGPFLRKTVDACLSTKHDERQQGHEALRALGPAGRSIAGAALSARLSDPDSFVVSEAAYSLGVLDPRQHKATLCGLVESRSEADILGRTLTVLRGAFDITDVPRIASWRSRFTASPPTGTRPERILKYLDYLSVYVEHKYQSDTTAHQ